MLLPSRLCQFFESPARPWYAAPLRAYTMGYEIGRQVGRSEVRMEEAERIHRTVEAITSTKKEQD